MREGKEKLRSAEIRRCSAQVTITTKPELSRDYGYSVVDHGVVVHLQGANYWSLEYHHFA